MTTKKKTAKKPKAMKAVVAKWKQDPYVRGDWSAKVGEVRLTVYPVYPKWSATAVSKDGGVCRYNFHSARAAKAAALDLAKLVKRWGKR